MSAFCHTQLQWKVMELFRNSIRKCECLYKNCSHWKNISKEKFRRHCFVVYVLIYPLSKFEGNRTNFLWVLALQVKRLIRENSAKYVNQTGNFYFQTKLKTAICLPIFNFFQWFLFYIRDFIRIITLTEKSKFEENCRS